MTKFADWPTDRIRELAAESGKPLEVVCALAFGRHGRMSWGPRLGTYYRDGDVLRELDILAEREEMLEWNTRYRMRLLISCRGFVPDVTGPLTYSLAPVSPLVLKPSFVAAYRSKHANYPNPAHGAELAESAAEHALKHKQFAGARPLVAFDMIKREDPTKKHPDDDFRLLGDNHIYGALESAVRAALHWCDVDDQAGIGEGLATFNIPICIFASPFWDVGIDSGQVAEPELKTTAYQTNAFPGLRGDSHTNVTALVTTRSEVQMLADTVDSLYIDIRNDVQALLSRIGPQ
ncbi:MAG: hypothetical protein KF773_14115 [Deltaproteobacteria bacterium]|nr:hypothetical protein [Deltaproteobacteria bacterium]